MARRSERIPLVTAAPGTRHEILVHRYGAPGARPKAYLQASLHADETPALLTQHHLIRLLDRADQEGAITGEIVVVPYANPIGLAQHVNGTQLGRYELAGGGNFNRNWPDLFTVVADRLGGRLTDDAEANVALIRAAMDELLQGLTARRGLDALRLELARRACDADFVLDLHCDDDALMHLFLLPEHWPQGQDLAAELGCRAVMLCEDSGGASFDETFSTPWTKLAARFPDKPIPPACFSCTVELRGQADVSDALAAGDARALFRFLQRRGLVAGDPGPLPEPLCEATRLDACDSVRSPASGVLSYAVELGSQVRKGDVIAHLIDPAAECPEAGRRAITCRGEGLVLARRAHKFAYTGFTIAKIVGREPLAHRQRGSLLED